MCYFNRLLFILILAFLTCAVLADDASQDDAARLAAAQAKMEANARAHQAAAATQASTNPSTHPADERPNFVKLLAGLPAAAQPKATGWDDASIAKAKGWMMQHVVGRKVRQQGIVKNRSNIKIAPKGNAGDIVEWDILVTVLPDRQTLFGFENQILLKTSVGDLTEYGRSIMSGITKEMPDARYVVFHGGGKLNDLAETWQEGSTVTFDAQVDTVTISEAHDGGDHGVILVSFSKCHAIAPEPSK